jgi:hypothetical protein
MKTTHPVPKSRLALEPLEDRALAASGLLSSLPDLIAQPQISATLSAGVLRVNGTFLADTIAVRQSNGLITVGGVAGAFAAAAVSRIEVNGSGGNDTIRLNSEAMPGGQPIVKPCTVRGGTGNDLIIGGYGNDSLYGEAGNDIIRGGNGNDLLVGGAGMDSLYGGAGNDRLIGDAADRILAGEAGTDVIVFQQIDPSALVNSNEAALRAALQVALDGWSFSRSQNGEKITVKNLQIVDVAIENGQTRLHLKADIRYQKTTGFPQFSVSGTLRFSVTPQLNASFTEGALTSATVKLANPNVTSLNLSNVPNWLDNSSEMRNFLEAKLAQEAPIDITAAVQTFLTLGGSFGPTIVA